MGTARPGELLASRAEDLDGPYLDPNSIIAFSAEQLHRHPELRLFRPDDVRYWVRGEQGAEPIYVLADLVFNPFIPPSSDQRVHCIANSSGVASASNALIAKRRAFLECVERDAFLRHWYGQAPPPKISGVGLPRRAHLLANAIKAKGWRVDLLDVSSACPVIAAVAHGPKGLFVGCAAGPRTALPTKALSELTICLSGLPPGRRLRAHEVSGPEDHLMYWRQAAVRRHAEFLFASTVVRRVSEVLRPVELHIPQNAAFVRLPSQGAYGKHVWRCLVPGLIPLTFGWDLEPRGLPVVKAALKSGAAWNEGADISNGDVLVPHPFG